MHELVNLILQLPFFCIIVFYLYLSLLWILYARCQFCESNQCVSPSCSVRGVASRLLQGQVLPPYLHLLHQSCLVLHLLILLPMNGSLLWLKWAVLKHWCMHRASDLVLLVTVSMMVDIQAWLRPSHQCITSNILNPILHDDICVSRSHVLFLHLLLFHHL